MYIEKVLYNEKWTYINNQNYEIKMLELKKGKPTLHLIYHNESIKRIAYKCENCNDIIETSWGKYLINQYYKNKCLCQKCSMKQENIRKLISNKTKEAMKSEIIKEKCSIAQKNRWTIEERNKRSKVSKQIIERKGIKELISNRTKEEMNKLNTKELCDPFKYMNDEDKKKHLYKTGKSISKTFINNHKIIEKARINRINSIKNNKQMQDRIIQSNVDNLLKRQSQIQKFISNYLNVINNFNLQEEVPINLYNDDNYDMSFLIIDFANKDFKIGIEVLGNYYHDGMIELLNGKDINKIKENASEFKINRFKRDLEKDRYFKENNWKILYLTENEIFNANWMLKINNFLINI